MLKNHNKFNRFFNGFNLDQQLFKNGSYKTVLQSIERLQKILIIALGFKRTYSFKFIPIAPKPFEFAFDLVLGDLLDPIWSYFILSDAI